MIDCLSDAGFPVIEATSFARSTVVPHLKDAELVLERIRRRPGTVYRALVPNARGAERAVASGLVDELLGLITVSATYLRHNQNMTVEQAIAEGIRAFEIAAAGGIGFTMALGMALWCPYEGRVARGRRAAHPGAFLGRRHPALLFRGQRRHGRSEAGRTTCSPPRSSAIPASSSATTPTTCREWAWPTCWPRSMPARRWSKARSAASAGASPCRPTSGSVGNLPTEDIVHLLNASGIDTGLDTGARAGVRARGRGAARDRADVVSRPQRHP